MKLFIIIIALTCFTNIECGTIKNLVETAASEVNRIASAVENAVSEASLSNGSKPIVSIKNASNNADNISRLSAGTNADKTPVQVKVEINLVVNYQTGAGHDNVKTSTDSKGVGSSFDVVKFSTGGVNAETAKDESNVDKFTQNVQVNREVTTISPFDASTVPEISKVVFPGPMSTVTRDERGYFVETVRSTTSHGQVYFPGSGDIKINSMDGLESNRNVKDSASNKPQFELAMNRPESASGCPEGWVMTESGYCLTPIDGTENKRNAIETATVKKPKEESSGCPKGLVMTANGYCLTPIDGAENKRNSIESASVNKSKIASQDTDNKTNTTDPIEPKANFEGGCLKGEARAQDGTCKKIEDY